MAWLRSRSHRADGWPWRLPRIRLASTIIGGASVRLKIPEGPGNGHEQDYHDDPTDDVAAVHWRYQNFVVGANQFPIVNHGLQARTVCFQGVPHPLVGGNDRWPL